MHRVKPASMSAEERAQYRAATCLGFTHHDAGMGDGSAYFTRDEGSRFYLKVFRGKAVRPQFHYWYTTAARRDQDLATWLQTLQAKQEAQKRRREPHTLKVGDVLFHSYGYDQTNVHFYEVVAVRGTVVDLQELEQERTYSDSMSGTCVPVPGVYSAEPLIARKRPSADNTVRVSTSGHASPWDGRPARWSSSH